MISFSSSEDLILLKSTFVETQGRCLRSFIRVYATHLEVVLRLCKYLLGCSNSS